LITPYFFDNGPGRRLFGLYHSPSQSEARPFGVLMCQPGPQEYQFSHRAFMTLSVALARRGFHVLRFDWSGTGDSSGNAEDFSLDDWRDDAACAARELRAVGGVERVAAVGMRLGATLLAMASAEGLALADAVLWDPVVRGAQYLDELQEIQQRNLALRHERGTPRDGEVLGFVLTARERARLEQLDLLAAPRMHAREVLVACSRDSADARALADRLASSGVRARYDVVPDEEVVRKRALLGESLVSTIMVRHITELWGGKS
jgi:pimeloyl-ACP methyl ester carboxylesterase